MTQNLGFLQVLKCRLESGRMLPLNGEIGRRIVQQNATDHLNDVFSTPYLHYVWRAYIEVGLRSAPPPPCRCTGLEGKEVMTLLKALQADLDAPTRWTCCLDPMTYCTYIHINTSHYITTYIHYNRMAVKKTGQALSIPHLPESCINFATHAMRFLEMVPNTIVLVFV